jgi:WD40 repeat protein
LLPWALVDTLPDPLAQSSRIQFAAQGKWVGVGTGYGRVWDLDSRTVSRQMPESALAPDLIALHPSRTLVASVGDGRLFIDDLVTKRTILESYYRLPNFGGPLPASRKVVGAELRPGHTQLLWALEGSWDRLALSDYSQPHQIPRVILEMSPDAKLQAIAMHPQGTAFATLSRKSLDMFRLELWDFSGRRLALLADDLEGANGPQFSLDGNWVVLPYNRKVTLFDVEIPELGRRREFEVHELCNFTALAFSPDGREIAAGSSGGAVRFWKIESGELLAILDSGGKWVNAIAYHPDGETLVVLAGPEDHWVDEGRHLRFFRRSGGVR